MSYLQRAREVGTSVHSGQRYGAGADYSVHLAMCESVLVRFGVTDEEILCAMWLHDTIEDTTLRRDLIEKWFSMRVLKLVLAVTDEPGENRKQRKAATYPKTRAAGSDAIIVKLGDRAANLEACLMDMTGGKLEMYRKEQPEFRKALRAGREDDVSPIEKALWEYVEGLVDRILIKKDPDCETEHCYEACCFCSKPTSWWTLRAGKEVGADDVACCKKCAYTHRLSELPSKKEWFAAQQVKSPRQEVSKDEGVDEFMARAPRAVILKQDPKTGISKVVLDGPLVWNDGLLIRILKVAGNPDATSLSNRSYDFDNVKGGPFHITSMTMLGGGIGSGTWARLTRGGPVSIGDPCETCGEPLTTTTDLNATLLGAPQRLALSCRRRHQAL